MCYLIIRSPKNTTFERFYGQYFHALSSNAAQIMRVVSPSSTDAEEQERTFNSIKGICKATSSGRSKEVIDNVLVHIQAELQAIQNQPSAAQRQDSNISRSSVALPKEENTIFTAGFIYKFKDAYQAHLERTADFLASGSWHQETPDGIEFFDGPEEPDQRQNGPFLAHFRSRSIIGEANKQQEIWQNLVNRASNGQIKK